MMSQTCLMRDILSRIAARVSPLGGGANGHQHRKAAIHVRARQRSSVAARSASATCSLWVRSAKSRCRTGGGYRVLANAVGLSFTSLRMILGNGGFVLPIHNLKLYNALYSYGACPQQNNSDEAGVTFAAPVLQKRWVRSAKTQFQIVFFGYTRICGHCLQQNWSVEAGALHDCERSV
jgi:hypothetical protein